jgi:poly-beta-1,6-N-acetyl-D-glucosamine synthase
MFGIIFWISVVFIIYSYVGYPLIITILAQLRPKREFNQAYTPTVTLIVAAYNEEVAIAAKLENTLALDYPADKLQIIFADDGSEDRTAEIISQYVDKGIILDSCPQRGGKMAALNRALGQATGNIIVFSDANNTYDSQVLRYLAAPFIEDRIGAVAGAKHVIQNMGELSHSEGLYWRYESFISEQETRFGCCIGSTGEILAIRRKLYIHPPAGIINDDFFISMSVLRQGYQLVYTPQARSYETVSASAKGEIIRRSRIIAGRYQAMLMGTKLLNFRYPVVAWQIISHKFTRPLVPFAMIFALIANIGALVLPGESLVTLAYPYNWVLLSLQILFYAFAAIGNLDVIKGKVGKLLYVPTFVVNSNLAALRGLYHYITNRSGHLWTRVSRAEYSFDQTGENQ